MLNCREDQVYFSHKCIMMVLQKIPWYDLSIINSDQISFKSCVDSISIKTTLDNVTKRYGEDLYDDNDNISILYNVLPFPSIVLYGQYGCTISVFALKKWRINKKSDIKNYIFRSEMF